LQILHRKDTVTHGTLKLSTADISALEIPLPPLSEQRAIAKRLSEQMEQVDAARQAAQAQLEWIDVLPSAILREVFGADT
jgi:restriction endonuclease S subunit